MAEYAVERFYRDVRLFRIYESTWQIQKLVIARNMVRSAAEGIECASPIRAPPFDLPLPCGTTRSKRAAHRSKVSSEPIGGAVGIPFGLSVKRRMADIQPYSVSVAVQVVRSILPSGGICRAGPDKSADTYAPDISL